MKHLDGRAVTAPITREVDVAVVGSGPAGAAVAREASRRGAKVLVLEAGPLLSPSDFEPTAFGAMASSYRSMGASVVLGPVPMPYVQGRMVGGSSPINGAICWRLPRDVYDSWTAADPALADALPWESIVEATDAIEAHLDVAPTDPSVAGRKNRLLADAAEALGLEHRPIRRNVTACRGSGLCMQGCPHGAKNSADRALLTDLADTELISSAPVHRVATGQVHAIAAGHAVTVSADKVVLAASAVQTPLLLLDSGLRHGPVGHHFQCHPGVSVAGRFAEAVRMWDGATQGHEVTGLRTEGLKFEALGFGPALLAARLPGVGSELMDRVDELAHWLDWGVAIKATAHGRVRRLFGRTVVQFRPSSADLAAFGRGTDVLAQLLFAAGADTVAPGIHGSGLHTSPDTIQPPRGARGWLGAITHMFGTARMGSDPAKSVVRPDFRLHGTPGVYVADSSVFPTNTGVNPQIAIMALATLCGREVTA